MPAARRFIESRAWSVLAWVFTGSFGILLAALIPSRQWDELRIAACFFLPLMVVMLVRHGLPDLLLAFIAACFLLSGAGWAFDWYDAFWWFDVVLHGLNPVPMMAGTMYMLWKADFVQPKPRTGRFVLIATALGLALGVVWELIEVTYLVLTWPDTLLDLVMDTAGAALGGALAAWIILIRGLQPVGRRGLAGLPFAGLRIDPAPVRIRR